MGGSPRDAANPSLRHSIGFSTSRVRSGGGRSGAAAGGCNETAGFRSARERSGSGRMVPEMSKPPMGNLFGRISRKRARE